MCENSEKTIQLEGYEFRQCEHGFCWQHSPNWGKLVVEKRPLTNSEKLAHYEKLLYWECIHCGLIMGLISTIKEYRKNRYHCEKKIPLIGTFFTHQCMACGRVEKKLDHVYPEPCSCCGYKF